MAMRQLIHQRFTLSYGLFRDTCRCL